MAKLTKEQFIKKYDNTKTQTSDVSYNKRLVEEDGYIVSRDWVTGGYAGGSCWNDDEPTRFDEHDNEVKFKELDNLLLEQCENIPWLLVETKVKPLIEYGDFTHYEYYGNSEEVSFKYIKLIDLYDIIEPYLDDVEQ